MNQIPEFIGGISVHELAGGFLGHVIATAKPEFSGLFDEGTVILTDANGLHRGVVRSLARAEETANLFRDNSRAYFPISVDDFSYTGCLDNVISICEASGQGIWLRPVGWKHQGRAFLIEHGDFKQVPSPRGAEIAYMPRVSDMRGEWQAVSPNIVLDGN